MHRCGPAFVGEGQTIDVVETPERSFGKHFGPMEKV
jgi:hypothetical protein